MRPIVVILPAAAVLIMFQAVRAQTVGPIRGPGEHIVASPELPRASCASYSQLPESLFDVDWRVFPPPGLLEEQPERFTPWLERWEPGVGEDIDDLEGPRFVTYDESGRIATWTSTSGPYTNPSERQLRTSYEYDVYGNLETVTLRRIEPSRSTNLQRWVFTHDVDDHLAATEHQVWLGDWAPDGKTRCVYDDAGRLEWRIGELCPRPSIENPNPTCIEIDSTRYDYDVADRITREYRRTRGDGATWSTPLPRTFTYDEAGNLVKEIDTAIRTVFEWVYDVQGRLSEATVVSFYSRVRNRYDYQYAGLLTRVANDTWINGLDAYAEEGELRYEYGPQLDLEAEYHFNGPSLYWTRRRYEYDDRGNLTRNSFEKWDKSRWVVFHTYDYAYHEAGFLEQVVSTTYDYVGSVVFKDISRVRYEYAVGTGVSDVAEKPAQYMLLEQNFPNPSNGQTTISYSLSQPGQVELFVYDVMGRQIRNLDSGLRLAGRHEVAFPTGDLPSGIYFYRLKAGRNAATRRLVVVR